jgi:hypothetical protein
VKGAYRYVNDHGEIFRLTETKYLKYLLAGTQKDKFPSIEEYGEFVCSVLTVNNFSSAEFSDEYNLEAARKLRGKSAVTALK